MRDDVAGPDGSALSEGLGPLVEYADKLRTLLFGLRDSDPGCTVAAWWGV
jgi:hypothetical protein